MPTIKLKEMQVELLGLTEVGGKEVEASQDLLTRYAKVMKEMSAIQQEFLALFLSEEVN